MINLEVAGREGGRETGEGRKGRMGADGRESRREGQSGRGKGGGR